MSDAMNTPPSQSLERYELRLSDESVDFYVDLTLVRAAGGWLAIANLASEPDLGTGATVGDAVSAALAPLGADIAGRMARAAIERL